MRVELIDSIVEDLLRVRDFRKVYKNTIPMWTDVREFPAVGIIYESDQMERENLVNGKAFVVAKVPIYIYNKQKNSDITDNLSGYVEIVQNIVEKNEFLRYNTVEAIVTDFKRDGGMLLPYSVAQLILTIRYIKKIG